MMSAKKLFYMSLEDTYQRLQARMFRIFVMSQTDELHFPISAKPLGNSLNEQLGEFGWAPLTPNAFCKRFEMVGEEHTATPTTMDFDHAE